MLPPLSLFLLYRQATQLHCQAQLQLQLIRERERTDTNYLAIHAPEILQKSCYYYYCCYRCCCCCPSGYSQYFQKLVGPPVHVLLRPQMLLAPGLFRNVVFWRFVLNQMMERKKICHRVVTNHKNFPYWPQ